MTLEISDNEDLLNHLISRLNDGHGDFICKPNEDDFRRRHGIARVDNYFIYFRVEATCVLLFEDGSKWEYLPPIHPDTFKKFPLSSPDDIEVYAARDDNYWPVDPIWAIDPLEGWED